MTQTKCELQQCKSPCMCLCKLVWDHWWSFKIDSSKSPFYLHPEFNWRMLMDCVIYLWWKEYFVGCSLFIGQVYCCWKACKNVAISRIYLQYKLHSYFELWSISSSQKIVVHTSYFFFLGLFSTWLHGQLLLNFYFLCPFISDEASPFALNLVNK